MEHLHRTSDDLEKDIGLAALQLPGVRLIVATDNERNRLSALAPPTIGWCARPSVKAHPLWCCIKLI